MPERDHIFISYRRNDAPGASGRLYDWLRIAFGRERVYRDVDSTGVGRWRDKIDAALAQSAACVAVIGPRWVEPANLVRLKDEKDMVRHELLTALNSAGLTMVPTLVEGARVPDSLTLPAELHPLFDTWNARPVTEDGWEDDTRRLIVDIAKETNLRVGPDLESLLSDVGAAQRIGEREQARDLQAGQIEALQGTISELTRKLAAASSNERSNVAAAFAGLAKGDTRAAENEFEREYEIQDHAEQQSLQAQSEARRKKADAARNVANLALLRNVAKAVRFYRKALEFEPDDAGTARLLGNALIAFGDLQGAHTALSQSLQIALAKGNARDELTAQGDLGRIAQLMGNLQEVDTALSNAVEIGERLLAADPANTEWQRDLWVSHERIGDLRVRQGDMPGALVAYDKGFTIAEALAARDPTNTGWQRDLSGSHNKIGDMLVKLGDEPAALVAYRKGFAIAEALAARDPANTEWQRDLAISHDRIGDMLVKQGDAPGALATYHKGLVIREALAALDPTNTQWQRDLSVSHERSGDMLARQGDEPSALAAYAKALGIAEALAARDPTNTQWQRDLWVNHNKIGEVLAKQGGTPGALEAYARAFGIAEALVARDPTNAEWQTDLARSCFMLGTLQNGQSAGVQRDYLRRGRDILLGLKGKGRLMPNLEHAIVRFEEALASGTKALG